MRISKLLSGLAGAGLLTCVGVAQATTISQSVTFGPGPTDFLGTTQNLNLFNTALGTLNSVTFTSTFGFTSNITVSNQAAGTSTGSVNTESASGFSSGVSAVNAILAAYVDTAGDVLVGGDELNPAAFDLRGTTRAYSLASGSSTTLLSNAATQTVAPGPDTAAADLAAFSKAGGGSFDVSFETITGTNLNNRGGNTTSSQQTTATGTFGVVYDYTAPPTTLLEPASIALMGVGLTGMTLLRRRRA